MDELNQVQDTAVESDDFFSDDATEAEGLFDEPETQDKPVEDADTVQESNDTTNDEAAVTPFLTVTYNKAQRGLTQDEAIEYAQKGMNYDKLHGQYEALKQSEPLLNELNRLAELNGMSMEDYLHNLNDVQRTFEISQELEALKQKYPNSSEEALSELASLQVNERAKQAEHSRQESVDSRKQEIGRQLDVFSKRHPDVDPAKLDSGVYDLMRQGYTLLEAYESVNAERREAQEKARISEDKIKQKNEENKRKSLGNTSSSGKVEHDDFLSGFLG